MFVKKGWKCCDQYDGSFTAIEMPPEFKHHSKAVCKYCNHFMKWLPNPKTLELMEIHQNKLRDLEKHIELLSSYEATFIGDMKNRKKMTPKQIAFLEALYEKIVKNIKI